MREPSEVRALRTTHDIIRRLDLIIDRGRPGHPEDPVRWWGEDSEDWGYTCWQRADIPRSESLRATWGRVDRYLRSQCG